MKERCFSSAAGRRTGSKDFCGKETASLCYARDWVMIDTLNGAEASTVVYSTLETAKANNLYIYKYLDYLLTELPKYIHDLETKIPEKLFSWSSGFPAELRK